MQFNHTCECCVKNIVEIERKKIKSREASRRYYENNREKVILRNCENYYNRVANKFLDNEQNGRQQS